MHNSTTDTIKDTYYFFQYSRFLTICMFDFFFLLLNINMFVLHLSLLCPTDWFFFTGRDPSTHRSVWKSMASHFPSVVGNFSMVHDTRWSRALSASVSHHGQEQCDHLSHSASFMLLFNYAAILDEIQPYCKLVQMLNMSTLSWYAYYITKEIT